MESDGAEKNSTKDEPDFNVSYEKHSSLVVCLDPCLFEIRERVVSRRPLCSVLHRTDMGSLEWPLRDERLRSLVLEG